jgi:hypothetical protein
MTKHLQAFIVKAPLKGSKKPQGSSFVRLAKRNIVKSRNPSRKTLSSDVDRILYGK